MGLFSRFWLIGLAIAAATIIPPRRQVGACSAGPVESAPLDLTADATGPGSPELVSAVLVKPGSRVGCSCGDPCVEEIEVEFTLRTDAEVLYVVGDGKAFYVERAEELSDGQARFYLAAGFFVGGPPRSFLVAAVDNEGRISEPISVPYDRDQAPEPR